MKDGTESELGLASIVRDELMVQAASELPKDSEFVIIIRLANGIQYSEFRCKEATVDELFAKAKDRIDKLPAFEDGFIRTYSQGAVDKLPILRIAMERRLTQLTRKFKGLKYLFCCFEEGDAKNAIVLNNVSKPGD